MTGPPFLEGERVELRPVTEDDAAFLQRLANDPRVRQGTGYYAPASLDAERARVAQMTDSDDHVPFLVTADCERVGLAGLTGVDETVGRAEIGYYLDPDAWGNGYATDAVRQVVGYAFDERRLHKLYALLFADNDASRRVLEKAGFRQEGYFREHFYRDGEYRDRLQYGLVADGWHTGR